jgi:hypothetical protein
MLYEFNIKENCMDQQLYVIGIKHNVMKKSSHWYLSVDYKVIPTYQPVVFYDGTTPARVVSMALWFRSEHEAEETIKKLKDMGEIEGDGIENYCDIKVISINLNDIKLPS